MQRIAVDRELLLHADFTGDFVKQTCGFLNACIDEELAKADADFDRIDALAAAINTLRENGTQAILPVFSDRAFRKTLGIGPRTPALKILAIAAAAAVVLGAGAVVTTGQPVHIVREVAQQVREFFAGETETQMTETEPPAATETITAVQTEPATVKEAAQGIALTFGNGFKKEYEVGEAFDPTGIAVYLIYPSGKRRTEQFEITTETPFAATAGTQTVTVTADGFRETFSVRILNAEKTPILNGIYATFPDGFDFTYRGAPDLSGMRVFAVYSTGEEKELSPADYTVEITEHRQLFRRTATVRLTFGGCDCTFEMEEVGK